MFADFRFGLLSFRNKLNNRQTCRPMELVRGEVRILADYLLLFSIIESSISMHQ